MNPTTIMLIDDDSDVLGAVSVRCRARGFNVLRAHNLLTATSLVQGNHPDVICVDVHLPTGNGLDFCESILENDATRSIPIVVLTGQRDAETLRRCQEMGLTYVAKRPDVWAELEPVLEDLIASSRNAAEATRCNPTAAATSKPGAAETVLVHTITESSPPIGAPRRIDRIAQRATIVIADDDTDLIDSLTQRCTELGFRVIGVTSALEAINAIHQVKPDLVLVDVNMPAGSGLGVCEMMSSDERLCSIPVIVLTGDSNQQTIRRCHDMMVYYVQKSADVWSRVEPLLVEMLGLPRGPANSQVAAATTGDGGGSALLDAVFAMLGDQPACESQPTASAESAAGARAAGAEAEPPWILCIDDDHDFSDALKCRLESYGVAVVRAYSGMEGYRLAFTHPARAILLDYNMPNGQGDYVLRRLKESKATSEIPVIVITGARDKSLERTMYGLGASCFLNKPVRFEALRDELARHIDILAEPVAV